MANAIPHSFGGMLWKGQISGLTDVFKIILMQPDFVFDQNSHNAYSDVIADELATGNGYTVGGQTLTGVSIEVNNVTKRAEITFNNAQWNATGGPLLTSGAIMYNASTDTGVGDDYSNAIVSYKDAGGTITAIDKTPVIISSIMETIGGPS